MNAPTKVPSADGPAVRNANGYSLIEMIVSMTVFSVGALGFASSSVVQEQQVRLGAAQSERSAAMVYAMESVRAVEFDSLASGADSTGRFTVDWYVTQKGLYTKEVRVITSGPGLAASAAGGMVLQPHVADTFEYQVVKP